MKEADSGLAAVTYTETDSGLTAVAYKEADSGRISGAAKDVAQIDKTEEYKLFSLDLASSHYSRNGFISKLAPAVERILAVKEINTRYSRLMNEKDGKPFTEKVLTALNIDYRVPAQDLERVPRSGPLIVVSNHPFGMIEGIILAEILTNIRRDVKIMANYLLSGIPQFRDMLISADPFGTTDSFHANFKAARQSMAWLKSGGMLVMFPSGEVSHLDLKKRRVTDPAWSETVARLVRKTGAGVMPVSFNGSNSALFHGLGLIHPRLRTFMLPHQLLNKADKTIYLKMGKPIAAERLVRIEPDSEMIGYIRTKTYLLRNYWEQEKKVGRGKMRPGVKFPFARAKETPDFEEIPLATSKELIKNEISRIARRGVLLKNGDYWVMHAKGYSIPNVLREIGRLREITFRLSGEGTGKAIDLDSFDGYYQHIFTWNAQKEEIVGAYRLGLTDEILSTLGKKGLYSYTLFKYGGEFLRRLNPAIELGRSFIRPEYQKVYSSLLLLWKGIARYVSLNPRYKTLFGLVSINNNYKAFSLRLMMDFLKMNNFDSNLSRLIKPRTPLSGKIMRRFDLSPLDFAKMDLEEMSSIVSDIEEDSKGVPILLKQYLKLGGTLLGFNLDSAFSNVLDGLILVDLTLTDTNVLQRYMGERQTSEFLAFHTGK